MDDALDVAPARSPRSTSATRSPALRSQPGDRAAHDPAADDEQVEAALGELLEHVVARRVGRERLGASHWRWTAVRGGGSGAGSSAHSSVPSSAAGGIVQSASVSPIESARRPIANDATPPRPIESPIESPAAVARRVGRYSCESTIVMPNVEMIPAPANAMPARPSTPGSAR